MTKHLRRFGAVSLTCLVAAICGAPDLAAQILISEIRIDQPGPDTDEYLELSGPPAAELDTLTYIVIGDGSAGSGVIEMEQPLAGVVVPADGYLLLAESTLSLNADPDVIATLNFENADNVTHLLVSGFSGSSGMDLDLDDDGVLDDRPWTSILDCVALLDSAVSGDETYCDTTVGPDGGTVPFHVFRDGGWHIGPQSPTEGFDTPGAGPAVLPVEVVNLRAIVRDGSVIVTWTVLGELDISGFQIRAVGADGSEHGRWIRVEPDCLESRPYAITLSDLSPGPHRIDLSAVFTDGSERNFGRLTATVDALDGFHLTPPFPNPTPGSASTAVAANAGEALDISVFDVTGRTVVSAYSGRVPSSGIVQVDLRLDGLPAGMYFLVARSPRGHRVRPVFKR